ncbi:unnamed protein product, partial [Polarella glacialis]
LASDRLRTMKRHEAQRSFFGLLRTGFPQVSGVLSFGKPAVLLAEGPLVELQRLVIE